MVGFRWVSTLVVFAIPLGAEAAPRGVGLGAAAGVSVPHSGPIKYSPSFDWGFFVDIPLIPEFHITPSALVYGVKPDREGANGDPNTDISLSFKFVLDLGRVDLFAGVSAGLTASSDLDPHVGGLVGFSLSLVSNLEVFAQANYRIILDEGDDRNDLHIFAGPLFRFR